MKPARVGIATGVVAAVIVLASASASALGADPVDPSAAPASTSAPATVAPTSSVPSTPVASGTPKATKSPSPSKASPATKASASRTSARPSASSSSSTRVQTSTGQPQSGGAPTGYGATAPTQMSTAPNGSPSPVSAVVSTRSTKKLGHFSVTNLLLTLIFVAGAVALVGAGGLWITRR